MMDDGDVGMHVESVKISCSLNCLGRLNNSSTLDTAQIK